MKPGKKIAAIIVSKMRGDSKQEESEEDDYPDEGLSSAAEELIAAIHTKDVEGVKESLRSFIDQCSGMSEE